MPRSKRDKQQKFERERSRVERDVQIPKCVDRRRRKRLEENDERWLAFYCGPDSGLEFPFWYEFTNQQKAMIEAIGSAMRYGGDQAIFASRGEGKTTYFERLLLKFVLQGALPFAVLLSATSAHAENSLKNIFNIVETGELLREDYPEVCYPARALQGTPQRAVHMTASGYSPSDQRKKFKQVPIGFQWSGGEAIFPRVPGSKSAGAIFATRGLDSAVRGLNRFGRRPRVVGIDDPDTDDTINNPDVSEKVERRIDNAIGGLGDQQHPVARVMLCTLSETGVGIAHTYADREKKPSFVAQKFSYLECKPDRVDLWMEFVEKRKNDQIDGDRFGRKAHRFYVDNRSVMDAGAVVGNPNRYDSRILPDGSQAELSALEGYYVAWADKGESYCLSELDNNPKKQDGPIDVGITIRRVQRQVSGHSERLIPPGCTTIVQGIDIGKYQHHFVVRAFDPSGTGYTVEYGRQIVSGTRVGTDEGLDEAIRMAIVQRFGDLEQRPFILDGKPEPISLTLVDSRYCKQSVCVACFELTGQGESVYPSMGCGSSAGLLGRVKFTPHKLRTRTVYPGDGWYLERDESGFWIVFMDSDRWKRWEHNRWMQSPDKPGALLIWGEPGETDQLSVDQRNHYSYAAQINAEKEVDEMVKGVLKRYWKKTEANHWLDASYACNVAAAMRGIPLLSMPSGITVLPQQSNGHQSPADVLEFESSYSRERNF